MNEFMTALMIWTCSFNDGFCRYEMAEMFVEPEECWDQEEIINGEGYDQIAFCMETMAPLVSPTPVPAPREE